MNQKVEDSTDGEEPCWEDYPSLLTIAQAAQILQAKSIRRASHWLCDAGLISTLSEHRRRVDKTKLRIHLQNLTADERNGRSRWN